MSELPTEKQIAFLKSLCQSLKIKKVPKPKTKDEASNLIKRLKGDLEYEKKMRNERSNWDYYK